MGVTPPAGCVSWVCVEARALTHVAYCADSALDGLALWDMDGQAQVWYPDVP